MKTLRVSFRREWDECFSIDVDAESVDQALALAQQEAKDKPTDWSNMEEVECIPIFVDDVDTADELWERPLSREEKIQQAAQSLLEALKALRQIAVWDEDSDRAEFDAAIAKANAAIAEAEAA